MNAIALIFAPMLALSAILAALFAARAKRSARDYLRFAAVLYLALAVSIGAGTMLSGAAGLVAAVVLVAAAIAPVSLALGLFATFEHAPSAWIATAFLAVSCLAGIAAAATGVAALSFAPLAASALIMLALCMRHWRKDHCAAAHASVSVCCLVCGAAVAQAGADPAALALFSSAAVLGFALALSRRSRAAVAEKRDRPAIAVAIGRKP